MDKLYKEQTDKAVIQVRFFLSFYNDNNKLKAFPLWGTSDMEHTPFYLHSHPLTQKNTHKQK